MAVFFYPFVSYRKWKKNWKSKFSTLNLKSWSWTVISTTWWSSLCNPWVDRTLFYPISYSNYKISVFLYKSFLSVKKKNFKITPGWLTNSYQWFLLLNCHEDSIFNELDVLIFCSCNISVLVYTARLLIESIFGYSHVLLTFFTLICTLSLKLFFSKCTSA